MNVGGLHHLIVSDRPVPAGNRRLGMRMRCRNDTQHRHPADRRRARRRLRDHGRLRRLHLLVGPRHRPRPRQPGVALRGAVRLHRQAAQGHHDHGRRPGARRRGGRDGSTGARIDDDRRRVASRRRQPLRLATGLRVDALHRAGRRRRSTCRSIGAEGDRGRVRRPPRRAVASPTCWASSPWAWAACSWAGWPTAPAPGCRC